MLPAQEICIQAHFSVGQYPPYHDDKYVGHGSTLVYRKHYRWEPGSGLGNPTVQDLTPVSATSAVATAGGSSGDGGRLQRQGQGGSPGTPATSPPPSVPGATSSAPALSSSQPVPPGLPAAGLQTVPAPAGDRVAQVQRAVDRLWKNDLHGALDELNQLASDPNDLEARRLRAMTRLAIGEVGAARAEAEALLAQRPDDPSLLLLHGQTALLINDTATARRDFDRVIRLAPDTSQGIYNQANQMLSAGVLPVAHLQYLTVIWLDPQTTGAYYGLGMTCARLGRRDQAIEAFERYIKLEPNGPQAQYVLQQLNQLRGFR